MLGKFAAVLGPLLMGTVALLTKNSRVSILAVIMLFAAGALCLLKVRADRRIEGKQPNRCDVPQPTGL